ncbi:MAG TPA: bifunctional phosphoribosylaminoimidazolecarboxamide formyltransferase/IMP cyclohydrolase [Thermomicrobiales bacterium]|nr:bifunctional phosphoribosylaminoimidazolecarboxamide formyltransferase/IMP cyclohydrolase [Thermomicrobiales bacterium]
MPTALISVWDKTGVERLATRLAAAGFELVSTGGTARALRDAGVPVIEVSDVTGFPEIMDGRVKTLHPAIHGGLLARRDKPEHLATLEQHGIRTIDVLVSNLYPFADVVRRPETSDENAIENIDIGGPAMTRAAAKNHAGVVVLTDPDDYDAVLELIERDGVGAVPDATRRRLAAKAFAHVATYDSLIASYLRDGGEFPAHLPVGANLLHTLRYGENPHQRAAVYTVPAAGDVAGIATWHVHDGREMSYNNYLDATAAWGCALDYEAPVVVIVKHTLPCGIGTSDDLVEAYERALSGDPVSAFGGIMACNRTVTEAVVEAIGRHRFDVMIAPGYTSGALERLLKKRNLRVITVGNAAPVTGWELRSVPGGLLVQEPDNVAVDPPAWICATTRQPTQVELETLAFAWRGVKWVKSNAIVLAQPGVVVGVGAGQPNRVESVRIAVKVAGERATGSVLASDAFFPFPDGVEAAAAAGVTAIVQPGGSVKDAETIAVAEAHGMTMLMTGERHFRH